MPDNIESLWFSLIAVLARRISLKSQTIGNSDNLPATTWMLPHKPQNNTSKCSHISLKNFLESYLLTSLSTPQENLLLDSVWEDTEP